jgi:hypothetical protein
MFVRVFLCCAVLCRYRTCDGLIPHPRSPTKHPEADSQVPEVKF